MGDSFANPMLAAGAERAAMNKEGALAVKEIEVTEFNEEAEDDRAATAASSTAAAAADGQGTAPASSSSWATWEAAVAEMGSSVWEATLLVGTAPIGPIGSVKLGLLLTINVVIQIGFLIFVIRGMAVPEITADSIQELHDWRSTVAHDVKYYNGERSLCSRVCAQELGLEVGAAQAALYDTLVSYVGEKGDGMDFLTGANGTLICLIGVLVWVLTCWGEWIQIYEAASVALSHAAKKTSARTTFCVEAAPGREPVVVLDHLSYPRLTFHLVGLAARAAISALLIVYGSLFLIYTLDVGELVLNVVALEFIMSTDELLFAVFMPARTKNIVRSVKWRNLHKARIWQGFDLWSTATLVLAPTLLVLLYTLLLFPQVGILVEARDALCGGDQDFVVGIDGLGVLAWAYPETLQAELDDADLEEIAYPTGVTPAENELNPFVAVAGNWNVVDRAPVSARGGSLQRLSPVDDMTQTQNNRTVQLLLRQFGRKFYQTGCSYDRCYDRETDPSWPQIRHDGPSCCFVKKTRVRQIGTGMFALKRKATETASSAVALWNPSCYDVLDSRALYSNLLQGTIIDAVNSVQQLKGNSSHPCLAACNGTHPLCGKDGVCHEPKCAHVQPFCHDDTAAGVRARQLCPQTCGCDKPRHPLALSMPDDGCGTRCVHSGAYRAALGTTPCKDVLPTEPSWVALMDDYDRVRVGFPGDWNGGLGTMVTDMRKLGCDYFRVPPPVDSGGARAYTYPPYIFGINMCWGGNSVFFPIKPLSYWCPEACGCRSGDPFCPSTCPAPASSSSDLCPSYQLTADADPTNVGDCPINWRGQFARPF